MGAKMPRRCPACRNPTYVEMLLGAWRWVDHKIDERVSKTLCPLSGEKV